MGGLPARVGYNGGASVVIVHPFASHPNRPVPVSSPPNRTHEHLSAAGNASHYGDIFRIGRVAGAHSGRRANSPAFSPANSLAYTSIPLLSTIPHPHSRSIRKSCSCVCTYYSPSDGGGLEGFAQPFSHPSSNFYHFNVWRYNLTSSGRYQASFTYVNHCRD